MTWAYIAGFFDGEGTLTHNGKGFRISISQTNKEVLSNIKDFAGFGGVCHVTKRRDHWKESWVYFIAKQESVYKFLIGVYPHLTVKKEYVKKIIPELLKVLKNQKKRKEKYVKKAKLACKFRRKGLSYRGIGKRMGLDHGYVRRLILGYTRNNNGGRSSTG